MEGQEGQTAFRELHMFALDEAAPLLRNPCAADEQPSEAAICCQPAWKMFVVGSSLLLATAVFWAGWQMWVQSIDVAQVHFIDAALNPCACNQSVERITGLASFQNNLSTVTHDRSGDEIAAIVKAVQSGCGFTECCCTESLQPLGNFYGSASPATKDRIINIFIDSQFPGAAIPPTWPSGGDLQYAPHCTPFPGKRVIIVTVNNDFFDMFRNWFHTAKGYIDNETDQLVVYPYDKVVASKLRDMSSSSSLPFEVGVGSSSRRLYDYMTPGYTLLVDQRPALLNYWLENNCTVFYVDIDTVWRRPIFPAIMAAAGARSLYLVNDGGVADSLTKYYCTCFIYANPVPEVKNVIADWVVRVKGRKVNQPPFNAALASTYVDYAALPEAEFPDGIFADHHDLNNSAVVLHANYRVGVDRKIAFFKQRGLWFV